MLTQTQKNHPPFTTNRRERRKLEQPEGDPCAKISNDWLALHEKIYTLNFK